MQLHPIDTEASPPYPRTCGEARALRNLPGVQDRKQSRVDEQRLWVSDHLGEDFAAHRLQEAPHLPHPPMQRGRVQPHHPGEQVRKEPLCVPQEGAFALHSPQLLEKCQSDDLRVRKPLYGFVASSATRVEQRVSVVDEAEEDGQSLFRPSEASGMVGLGHLLLLREGRLLMAPFLSRTEDRKSV